MVSTCPVFMGKLLNDRKSRWTRSKLRAMQYISPLTPAPFMFSLVYDPLWPREMLQRMRREWAALVHLFVMFFFVSALVQLLMNEER